MKRNRPDTNTTFISMLDLLTGALAAFLILFVMVDKNENIDTSDSVEKLTEIVEIQQKVIENQNEKLEELSQEVFDLSEMKEKMSALEKAEPPYNLSSESGAKFALKNLHFYGGTSDLTVDSIEHLKEVADYLKKKNVSFLIEGHVNAPGTSCRENLNNHESLSEDRAKTVFKYFVDQGIAPQKMRHAGAGCSKMVYPYASNEREREANRRVEITIL